MNREAHGIRMELIIRHVSDTHGNFPEATQNFDFTIISGDIFPDNFHDVAYRDGYYKHRIAAHQEHWLKRNKQRLSDWGADKPVYYIHGNHDFLNETSLQRELGWTNLNNSYVNHYISPSWEIGMYGFPYVPWICSSFNYELSDSDMVVKVFEMNENFAKEGYPNILVTHSPPYGILDKAHTNLGNRRLLNAMSYMFPENSVHYILCGHIHEDHGIHLIEYDHDNILVSNAATTQNYIHYV